MKELNINIRIEQLALEELSPDERKLVEYAERASHNAYAEYSHFYVGAAVLLRDGTVVIGANQENAAFPSGLCAERTALFAAQAQHPDQPVTALAIAARNGDGLLQEPVTPCGACRQVMLGVEERYRHPIRILLYGKRCVYRVASVKDLLPLSFVDSSMF